MNKLVKPEGYEVYKDANGVLYALDMHNHQLINREFVINQSYWKISEDREVEGYVMDFDKANKTANVNFDKKVRVKMNQLKAFIYWVEKV